MKIKLFSFFVIAFLFASVSAQKTIIVTNTSAIDRKNEIVEVKKGECKKNDIPYKSFILKNEIGEEVGYQIIYNDKHEASGFIFQANVKANSSAVYTITEGTPAPVKAKTFGRFVPERKDDFTWENDYAAYRMYGPALAKENPSNGVDFWAKKTDELIVNEFYDGELRRGLSYHRDRGLGLDFYKVAHTLGCGGVSLYVNDSLWVGDHYNAYKVLENGPLRTTFTLTYDSVKVGNDFYKETITIVATAGSLLNKGTVTYTGKNQKMKIAAGIFLHDGKGSLKSDGLLSTLTYAENAVTEFGDPTGRNYVGIIVPGKTTELKNSKHALLLSEYKSGKSFTYYFGGGWNAYKFPSDTDWTKAVENFQVKIQHPLKVNVK